MPLVAVAGMGTDEYLSLAELVDARLVEILHQAKPADLAGWAREISDLSETMSVLLYVGFRRAKFVSSAPLRDAIMRCLARLRETESSEILSSAETNYIFALMRLARARFDTQERADFAALCLEMLDELIARGLSRVASQEAYEIVRLFAFPARVHPTT